MGLEGALGVVADHERGAALPEQLVDVVREPARMPKLEAVAARWQLGKGSRQPVVVAVEILRQLPQQRSELARAPQRLDVLVEPLDPRPHVGEPLHVGQIAARLDREQEALGGLGRPPLDGGQRWQPVEGVVHFDGVERLRVMLEPAPRWQPLGVEALAPVTVVPTRAADPDRLAVQSHGGDFARERMRAATIPGASSPALATMSRCATRDSRSG